MYQQFNENAYLDKVINMVDKFREELVAMKKEATATTVEEIIEHEGLKLRKVNREAREGDYIRQTAETESVYILKGKIYGPVDKFNTVLGEESTGDWEVYNSVNNRTPSTVEVFEVVKEITPEDLPFPEVELSANQRRAALIEKAKAFVEEQKFSKTYDVYKFNRSNTKAHFYRKNNRVTCVLKGSSDGITRNVGRADCSPNDVFNEHIGRAIALARALEIKVPIEFVVAVQPNEVVKGMKISRKYWDSDETYQKEVKSVNSGFMKYTCGGWDSSVHPKDNLTIIDDTKAKYEVN